MIDNLAKKLEKEGKLAAQKVGIVQIEALLKESIIDLEESKKTLRIADRATYIMAYTAMLKAGRALLLLKGYRPIDGAQHKTVVEMTGAILGDKYTSLVSHFETMRRKRNELTYEAGTLLSGSESKQALNDATLLVKNILKEAKSRNPQLELEL
jgi:uncharacterized protein (UPF0332 family)